MATVPRSTTSQIDIGPLPTSRIRRQGPFATPDAFGAATGEVTAQTGEQITRLGSLLMQGAAQLRDRQDAVLRASDQGLYRTALKTAFTEIQLRGSNFAEPDELTQFNAKANDVLQELLSGHKGTTTSRLLLQGQLIDIRDSVMDATVSHALTAQRQRVDQQLEHRFADLADMAGKEPMLTTSLFQQVDNEIKNFAGVFTPEEAQNRAKAGREQVLTSAVESFLALGQVKEADQILTEHPTFLSPDVHRRFRNRVIVAQTTDAKAQAEIASRWRRLNAMGIIQDRLTTREKLAIEGINLPSEPARPRVLSDEVAEFEAAMSVRQGKAYSASPDEIRKLAKITGNAPKDKGPFGSSLEGVLIPYFAANAPRFAAGVMSPEEDLTFIQAASTALRPNIQGIRGELAQPVRRALEMRGINPDRLVEPEGNEIVDPKTGQIVGFERFLFAGQPQIQPPEQSAGQAGAAAPTVPAPAGAQSPVRPTAQPQVQPVAPAHVAPIQPVTEPETITTQPGAQSRFRLEEDEIIDTKANQIISVDQFNKISTPEEKDDLEQQIQLAESQKAVAAELKQTGLEEQAEGTELLDPSGALMQQTTELAKQVEASRKFEAQGGMLSKQASAPKVTLFNVVRNLTGLSSGAKEILSGITGVGDLFPFPEVRQARQFLEVFTNDFTRVLRANPKYADTERKDILKMLGGLTPRLLGSVHGMMDDLIGLDNFLAEKETNARETVKSGRVSKDIRGATLNVLDAIGQARKSLGVPRVYATPQDVAAALDSGEIKPGDPIRTPKGEIKKAPDKSFFTPRK